MASVAFVVSPAVVATTVDAAGVVPVMESKAVAASDLLKCTVVSAVVSSGDVSTVVCVTLVIAATRVLAPTVVTPAADMLVNAIVWELDFVVTAVDT